MDQSLQTVKEIHLIPYCHTDYAWTNPRAWHISRYLDSLRETLEKMRQNPQYTGTLDNAVHSLQAFIRYYPALFPDLKDAITQGRIAVANGGYSLARPTQVGEETYLRNLIAGDVYFRSLFEEDPAHPLPIRCLFNADTGCGHPQLPQIIRLMGYDSYFFQRPECFFNKVKLPNQFIWQGLDGSRITAARGNYGGFFLCDYLEKPPTAEAFPRLKQAFWKQELSGRLKCQSSPIVTQFVGCDNTLPDRNLQDSPLYLDDFIRLWNQTEESRMGYSTLNRFFDALQTQPLPVVTGDINPEELTYNIPKKGNQSLWYARGQADRLLTEWETLSVMAGRYGVPYPEQQLAESWQTLYEITGHATDFALQQDEPELTDAARWVVDTACRGIRRARQALADAFALFGKNTYTVCNPTGFTRQETMLVPLTETFGLTDFSLQDDTGNTLPYSVVDYSSGDKINRSGGECCVTVAVTVTVPAFGVTRLTVCPVEGISVREKTPAHYLLTGPGASRQHLNDFTLQCGKTAVRFAGGLPVEITGSDADRTCRIFADGKPLVNLYFHSTAPSTDWLFRTDILHTDAFCPQKSTQLCVTPRYACIAVCGTMAGQPAELTFTLNEQGTLQLRAACTAPEQDGFFAVESPTDGSGNICCDIPFGRRSLRFAEIKNRPDRYDHGGEISMQGGFGAKSFLQFAPEKGQAMALVGVDTACYARYDLTNDQVGWILNAHYRPDKPEQTVRIWEHQLNARAFACPEQQHYALALVPFATDPAGLARAARGLRHPLVAVKGFGCGQQLPPTAICRAQTEQLIFTGCYWQDSHLILRGYEAQGKNGVAPLLFADRVTSAYKTDLRGRKLEKLYPQKTGEDDVGPLITLPVRPYEIVTVQIDFG